MIKFHLPDFFYNYNLNILIANLLNECPEKFYPDIQIGSIYGSFPNAYWNGGRVIEGVADRDNIYNTINNINILDIPVRFTFTNILINEHLLYDPYCNNIMKIADNGMNEVLINHPLLEEYLKDNYPNFRYISSTTKCIIDIDEFNKELDKYYLTVMDYRKNNDKDFHNLIRNKKKVEILLNAYCSPKCLRRKEHYEYLSRCQQTQEDSKPFCDKLALSFQEALKFESVIKVDDLYDYYVKEGFEHFKIEGRTLHPIDVIDSYVYYMVLPCYQDEMRNYIVKSLWRI